MTRRGLDCVHPALVIPDECANLPLGLCHVRFPFRTRQRRC
jgi:hypothetical protein